MTSLQDCIISEEETPEDVSISLNLFINKLDDSSRSCVKRCKERCLEEAAQLLRKIPETQLRSLKEKHLLLLVRLLISMQWQMVNISMACRKLDQMLQYLSKVEYQLVFREINHCLLTIVQTDKILSTEDLQRACMFLEDSAFGREAWRENCQEMLIKVAELFPVLLQQEGLTNGPLCYVAVKVCLQMFQLLPSMVAPLAWVKGHRSPALQNILQALVDIILGKCSNRDTRLLAGTAVAMLINTAPEDLAGGAAAWSLLKVSKAEPWLLMLGELEVRCNPTMQDGVHRLAVIRGLLTCCRSQILLSSHTGNPEVCILLGGVFPLVCALCEEKLDCLYYAFEVLTLWLKKVKASLTDIWKMRDVRLLPDDCNLQQELIQVIWNNTESPIEGVSQFVRSSFSLLLELYEADCKQFGDTKKTLYLTLLQRVTKLPWEAKAKYPLLCALLPYLGTDKVLKQYIELPNHLLKCLSTNHLSPCASELYKCMIQQQKRELNIMKDALCTELDVAQQWARRWCAILLEALTSEVTLLQNNSSTYLLPCTLHVFPSATEPLLASLDPATPGHLHAWACIVSSHRAITGSSSWAFQEGSASETLHMALGSVDDKVRLAVLNLLCCSSKTKDPPTSEELSILRAFIPQNLNSESSPFRQHFQAAVKRFLVRIRDSCLAHVREQKGKKNSKNCYATETDVILDQGIGFVEWLGQVTYSYLAPGHSYQRKKTVLLLLSAVLETCTDTWSPDKKKGQPPVNMASLIDCAKQRGLWDFFCRAKQLILIGCLEDSTNEIRELSAGLLLRFFPPSFPDDISSMLLRRTRQLFCSPRVQEAQMGALMMKVLLQKSQGQNFWLNSDVTVSSSDEPKASFVVRYLVKELEQHYLTASADMMLAARTKPMHGILSALGRCLLELAGPLRDIVDRSLLIELLGLLEKTSQLLLGVLYGARDTCTDEKDTPPSFCDMGNAISSLIVQAAGKCHVDGDESVLLSEEHSLVLTCCWVSLKEIGIFLGSLVERIIAESKPTKHLLKIDDLKRASKIFKDILLRCRHWGAVEGCCVGFTKFCASLLSSSDPDLQEIPAHMLKLGLQVLQSARCSSVTRRAAGLPMLILCVVSAEEASKARPLLANSMHTLLAIARTPIPLNWDQTLDLPQVCAVHTLQTLVRGSGLGVAILQYAPEVAILSLTLLSSPCWAMRNAALQLYSSLCSRMLGQRPGSEEDSFAQHAMSPPAFFIHYPMLQPFLLGELREAAQDFQDRCGEARLHLHPSLYPVLTLLAKLQPGVPDPTIALSDFLVPLIQLAASPIYSVRVMASKALVAMTPSCQYRSILIRLTDELPEAQTPCCHNRLHGQLLQIKDILDRALRADSTHSVDLCKVVSRVEALLWLVTDHQRCPLVRGAYLAVAGSLRGFCSEAFLHKMNGTLLCELHRPQHRLQVLCMLSDTHTHTHTPQILKHLIGSSSFHQKAIQFLCADPRWACQTWDSFSAASPDLRLSLVTWVVDWQDLRRTSLQLAIQRVLQSNLREALLNQCVAYRSTYLAALVAVMIGGDSTSSQQLPQPAPLELPFLLECLELLLGDLESQKGGPEFLSHALCAASLLLSQSLEISMFQCWSSLLERHRSPEVPEALRMACAEALCLAGVSIMSQVPEEHSSFPVFITAIVSYAFIKLLKQKCPSFLCRLINTGLYLLQDGSQPVRVKAAHFTSMLHCAKRGGEQRSVYLMQVNQALLFLLDLLLEEYWDNLETMEVLLCHLPKTDLRSVLRDTMQTGCGSLYEQDEANVFAEPAVMSAYLLPYLLQIVDKYCESSALAECLNVWAKENAAQVLDGLSACKDLQPGETLNPTWLSLLMNSRFHGTLCGLFTTATLLLQLLKISDDLRALYDPSSLQQNLLDVFSLLGQNGVQFPSTFTAAVGGDLPVRGNGRTIFLDSVNKAEVCTMEPSIHGWKVTIWLYKSLCCHSLRLQGDSRWAFA
ncbi:thyroid adenoma-associated protein homolog [Lampris incognitus]|uniref:thyroid adenoma-associated protein homolog n=1 Tax=Lampris incognitus TaxID=2546036 RepID=UPI0024B4CE9F|nr:thyroid adenoma-associated protein homolog [Lampris incognitus]